MLQFPFRPRDRRTEHGAHAFEHMNFAFRPVLFAGAVAECHKSPIDAIRVNRHLGVAQSADSLVIFPLIRGQVAGVRHPRLAGLIRAGDWTSRVSVGRGFFATTPLTEETEAAGLTRLEVPAPLRAERGTSVSWDVTRAVGPLSVTATAFGSRITDPVAVDRDSRYVLFNRTESTTNVGAELLATARV